jgi:hypothetical protein
MSNETTHSDRAADVARELGRLTRLRDDIDQPALGKNALVQERLRRLANRICAVEDELSYEVASSLPGALGQAILAYADICCMLESEFEPGDDLQFKERVRRLIWSITKCLERETGIDAKALAGSYAPASDPFADFRTGAGAYGAPAH